ncbi:MAG: hypothetical protein WC782_11125, partial [Methylococcaceae bacterium]
KPLSADDSVAVCHAKVGNCQAPNPGSPPIRRAFFCPTLTANQHPPTTSLAQYRLLRYRHPFILA